MGRAKRVLSQNQDLNISWTCIIPHHTIVEGGDLGVKALGSFISGLGASSATYDLGHILTFNFFIC